MSSVGFKFEDVKGNAGPKTIQKVSELETFLVGFKDNEGRDQVRIAMRMPDGSATFLLQDKIAGNLVTSGASKWFHDALSKANNQSGDVESV